ncbi:MAG: hypothetical protein P8106_06770 [Gammaproteobacteria bacterium]|jgi:hypothetical protein
MNGICSKKGITLLLGGLAISTVAYADPPPVRVNNFITEGYAAYTEVEARDETPGNPGSFQSNVKSPVKQVTAAERAAAQAEALYDARSKAHEFCHYAPDGYNLSLYAVNYSVLIMTDDGVGYTIYLAHDCELED